jgi:hypothetical protein
MLRAHIADGAAWLYLVHGMMHCGVERKAATADILEFV